MSQEKSRLLEFDPFSNLLKASARIDYADLEAYVDERYEQLQQEITDMDSGEFEGQLRVVERKAQQRELVNLLKYSSRMGTLNDRRA